ncbi:MAG: hypothetical protein ONB23_07340 [candidate division KSB1 bacterium]|nr:hypothetical protein [candidate division KSB1 bacterium]
MGGIPDPELRGMSDFLGGRTGEFGACTVDRGRGLWALVALGALVLAATGGCRTTPPAPWALNYDHLVRLSERVVLAHRLAEIVHIYCEYPGYRWTDAPGEGIACVDDAARASVVWLQEWSRSGDREALDHARRLLRFLLAMQQENGTFANFVDADLRPNLHGTSSRPSLGWWTARAAWALASGWRHFRSLDPAFGDSLSEALERLHSPLDTLMARYGQWEESARPYPKWLVNGSGADATATLVLALLQMREDPRFRWSDSTTRRLLEGILAMQVTDPADSLHGALLCYRDLWHAWGSLQLFALVRAWRAFGDPSYLEAALQEARHWRGRLLVHGLLHEVDVRRGESRTYPQIAYDIRPAVWGLLALAEATGDTFWSVAAGLWASWFIGNNDAGIPTYDAHTGRTFDGITGPGEVNRNAGAESTVEALLTLQAVSSDPVAMRALTARWDSSWDSGGRRLRRARTPAGARYVLAYDSTGVFLLP